jgi:CheY-like chemotaxis protein
MDVQTTERLEKAIEWSRLAEEETLGGTETVLFVEDEAFVRDVICEVLKSVGYRVLTATNAAEAMRLLQTEQRRSGALIIGRGSSGRNWVGISLQAAARKPTPQDLVGDWSGADGAARGKVRGTPGETVFHGDAAEESAAVVGLQRTPDQDRRGGQASLR